MAKKSGGFLEDLTQTGIKGLFTSALAMSFLGLEYLSEMHLKSSIMACKPHLTSETGYYIAQLATFFGAWAEGTDFIYHAAKIPFELMAGKYSLKEDKK